MFVFFVGLVPHVRTLTIMPRPHTDVTTHSVALATIRDATVGLGAECGLSVRVERAVHLLRQQRQNTKTEYKDTFNNLFSLPFSAFGLKFSLNTSFII